MTSKVERPDSSRIQNGGIGIFEDNFDENLSVSVAENTHIRSRCLLENLWCFDNLEMTSKIYNGSSQLIYGYISDDTSDYFTWVSVS